MQGNSRKYDLKQVRALANMTQREAAELIGVHPVTYSRIESNPRQLTLGQAWLLAEAAGIGVEQIKI